MKLTAEDQLRATASARAALVANGMRPDRADAMVRRAAARARKACCGSCRSGHCCDGGGLGIHQTRSLRRDLDPSIAPRQVIAGNQCVRLAEIPGNETVLYQQLDEYRNRGWDVTESQSTKGWPSVKVYWACPPGRTPTEGGLNNAPGAADYFTSTPAPSTPAPQYPTAPPSSGTPQVLASIAAAGDDPSIAAARNIVSKWSWLIPVGGLLMSAKSKLSSALGKGDPALAVAKGMRRR